MFLPDNLKDTSAEKAAETARNEAYKRIDAWCLDMVPLDIRTAVEISVQEVVCGDPECAPIDTAIAIIFKSGGRGMMGLPMEAKEVTLNHIREQFPPNDVLVKWHKGEEVDWPPSYDGMEDLGGLPDLRFEVGQKVECRVGPDEVTGWAKGVVKQLWYRESDWAEGSYAPYKVTLDDNKEIFAPGDVDMVIRAQK